MTNNLSLLYVEDNIKSNTIIQLLSRLRKKIFVITGEKIFFIESIYKKGYKLK